MGRCGKSGAREPERDGARRGWARWDGVWREKANRAGREVWGVVERAARSRRGGQSGIGWNEAWKDGRRGRDGTCQHKWRAGQGRAGRGGARDVARWDGMGKQWAPAPTFFHGAAI